MSQGTKGKTSKKKYTPKFYTGDVAVDCPIIDPQFACLTTEEILKTTQALERGVVDTGAKKNDDGKLRLDLIPVSAIIALAEVLTFGAKKYSDRNWEAGFEFTRVYAAAMRHLLLWFSGETLDPETKLNHLKHSLCNLAFLIEFTETHPELDNRPRKRTIHENPSILPSK